MIDATLCLHIPKVKKEILTMKLEKSRGIMNLKEIIHVHWPHPRMHPF